ncbi:cytochrome P450 10 [Halyomorpha halys]|uniref:cytochrome P450 10 n=1 Tax=Halyomorpha halys TaxID=286706 RepID=UPI0006D4F1EC|nr:cytochrome P450 10-like [Halyomorpha halys]
MRYRNVFRGIYAKRSIFKGIPRNSYLAHLRSVRKTLLQRIEVDQFARSQKEEVYVLPFDEIPGPKVPSFIPSKYIVGPIQQAHSTGWFQPYEMLFTRYGPLVRVNGDSLLVSHPRYIEAIMAISLPNRSALSTMERKRRLSLPIRMPEYELDFTELSEKYADLLNFKPNHFNKRIEVASDQLISRMYYTRNLQHEVPNFDEELYQWGLQSMFCCLFSRDCTFLQDPIGNNEFGPKSGIYQTYQTFLNASYCLAEAEAGPLGRLVRQHSVANHIDVMNGILCRNLRTKYLALWRDTDKELQTDLVEAMILRDKMNSNDILTRLCDIVILGVNIVAHSVGFLIYHLAKSPVYQPMLHEAVMKADSDNLHCIDFMNYCIYESMRLIPPFPSLSRDLDRDIILHGYGIPKGIQVHMINEVANMRKDMFPQTTVFSPERWPRMGKEPMLPHNYQLLPLAPVAPLLHAHVSVLTAKLVKHFKFEYHYGEIKSGQLLAKPNKPFLFTFIDRDREGIPVTTK